MERASGTCNNSVGLPVNGVRAFSSWSDCNVGRFTVVSESNGSGVLPTSLTCDNCTSLGAREGRIAPGSSANIRAYLAISGGTEMVRYDATFTRSATAPYTCSLNGSIRGASFGGDAIRPSVEITGVPESLVAPANFDITITFSEPVTGFTVNDIVIKNASIIQFGGSGATYTASVQVTDKGEVSVQVSENSAFDAGGDGNEASAIVKTENKTVKETRKQISQFMATRANHLVSNQPDLICMLSGTCETRKIKLDVSEAQRSFSFTSGGDKRIWMRIQGAHSRSGSAKTEHLLGALGAHWNFDEHTLVGLSFEFDHHDQTDGAASIHGTGWLAGPYIVGRLPAQPLFFEGRVLWGQSDNKINPFGLYSDKFETERILVQGRVAGQFEYASTIFTTGISGSFTKDAQWPYVDSLGNLISAQSVELSQFSLDLDISRPVMWGKQLWILGGGLSGHYTSTNQNGLDDPVAAYHDNARGRVHLNASSPICDICEFSVHTFYDGIGASNFEVFGADLELKVGF